MGNPKSHKKPKMRSAFQGSAAGVGAGTLLVLLANNLAPNNPWKPWLVLLAPSVSVALGAFLTWSSRIIQRWLADRQRQFRISRAKCTLQAALNNPNTSAEHKDQLRRELESLELLSVQADLLTIRSLMLEPQHRFDNQVPPS
jgi:hypothetical protein